MSQLHVQHPPLSDLDTIAALETQGQRTSRSAPELTPPGYPADEKASRENLEYRLRHAHPYFIGGYLINENMEKQLVGYVCGTTSELADLTHESMFRHVPDGSTMLLQWLDLELTGL